MARIGNVKVRLWSSSDIARLKDVKKKIYQEKRARQ
jgi:hypothetical protein